MWQACVTPPRVGVVARSVWAQIFARFIWPRIGAATELEDDRPARFAQFLGFVLTAPALLGFVLGGDGIGYGLTAVAIAGAVINATWGVLGLPDPPACSSSAAGPSLMTICRPAGLVARSRCRSRESLSSALRPR